MGDRFGPRIILTRIVLWWSAFTALTGAVSSYPLLVLTRLMFGAGEAGAFPNSCVAISRWFPVGERGRAFGFLSMAMQAGGALSPLLVVPIQAHYGWRASFYVFALVGVAWAVVLFFWFRNKPLVKGGISNFEMNEIGSGPGGREPGVPRGGARGGTFFDEPMNLLTCIDVARKSPGSMAGAYNTAAYGGSFLSGVVFGYVAKIFDSYDLPLILTAFVLGFGALMWLKIDPTQELISADHALLAKA